MEEKGERCREGIRKGNEGKLNRRKKEGNNRGWKKRIEDTRKGK